MIFVDSNVPMYLVGAAHPHKQRARRLLEQAVVERDQLVTDAEVLQEILHRYVAIERTVAIQPAFDALLGVVDRIESVEAADVEQAKTIVLGRYGLSAREAVHIAVMQRLGARRLISFDRGFDRYPGLDRRS